jgi:PP-loop superfamily ATP-utilizing enzyme
MDESDPLITFDESGLCSRCAKWERRWAKKLELETQLPNLIKHIKEMGHGREYDAVLGMSGGADSSWVYHLAKTAGLRVHPIHFDNGYDLPVSVHNVRCLTDFYGDKVEVIKVDGPAFAAMQLAFLKSGTTGLEIPTDHAIKAVTYHVARGLGVSIILNGTNLATESHGSPAWTQGHADWKYISSVAKQFGADPETIPHYSMLDYLTWMRRYEWMSLLEYVKYVREDAIAEMERIYEYQPYGFKHMESRITRFLHGYIIPRRFGWDTRRSRLSAMICSSQMTREDALDALTHPAYPPEEMESDKALLCHNLGITLTQFEELMQLPLKHFEDYPSYVKDMKNPPIRAAAWLWRHLK